MVIIFSLVQKILTYLSLGYLAFSGKQSLPPRLSGSSQELYLVLQIPDPLGGGTKLGGQSQVLFLKLPYNVYDLTRGLTRGLARGIVYRFLSMKL
jgi:hypothetical protein